MSASDSLPIGIRHPTVNPHPNAISNRGRSEQCECNDCDYAVDTNDELPPKCPACGGALTLVRL